MENDTAALAFATLGHPGRLKVLRMLLRFAPQGMRPTQIAAALQMKPNTLSHHLNDLAAAGLISHRRQGTSLIYTADLAAAMHLIGYLALDFGRGRPDLLAPVTGVADRTTAMPDTPFNVLFLCSGNSARSIFAECLLRDLGGAKFCAYSAGIRPNSQLNAFAVDLLRRNGHDVTSLRSKHISEFQTADAPVMDFVFTVCDAAAAEECPPWPGQPITGHWGLPDPVKAQGSDAEKALVFAQTYGALRRRIAAFVALPLLALDRIAIQSRVDQISHQPDHPERP